MSPCRLNHCLPKAAQLNGLNKNMFDKFKELAQLKALQDQAKKEKFSGEISGVTVVVNGSFTVEEVTLNPELDTETQARTVKDATNAAIANAQKGMAAKLQGMI